jgi:hypothetical protein
MVKGFFLSPARTVALLIVLVACLGTVAKQSETDSSTLTARELRVDSARGRVAISLAYTSGPFLDTSRGEVRLFDALSGAELQRTPVSGVSWLHLSRSSGSILALTRSEMMSPAPRSLVCGSVEVRAFFADLNVPPSLTTTLVSVATSRPLVRHR